MIEYVLIKTELGSEDEVLEAVEELNEVKEAHIVQGAFDIVVKLEAEDKYVLSEIAYSTLYKFDKVQSTRTLIVIER